MDKPAVHPNQHISQLPLHTQNLMPTIYNALTCMITELLKNMSLTQRGLRDLSNYIFHRTAPGVANDADCSSLSLCCCSLLYKKTNAACTNHMKSIQRHQHQSESQTLAEKPQNTAIHQLQSYRRMLNGVRSLCWHLQHAQLALQPAQETWSFSRSLSYFV